MEFKFDWNKCKFKYTGFIIIIIVDITMIITIGIRGVWFILLLWEEAEKYAKVTNIPLI